MSLTFTDIFCGAGGSSSGLTAAGLRLVLAANHWPTAISTHAANFAGAEHLCADVNNYDMRRLPGTDVLWASPICTEASPAGKKSRRARRMPGQGDLLEAFGPIARAGFERTRATFHDVIRATEVHRYRAVLVENVPEVADEWELFPWWVQGMCLLGYQVQYVSVSSAHVGGAGNVPAPQWRDRLYLVFTLTGVPLPDVDPRPAAWCPGCGTNVAAVQWWKKPGPRIGRYRRQYLYRCPNTACRHAVVEPYVRPAAAIIDWSNLGERIGDRARPLAASTMRRIEAGLAMFADPVVVAAAGNTWERPGSGYVRAWPAYTAPLGARTCTAGDAVAVPPFLTVLRNHGTHQPIDRPAPTVTAGGNHLYLTVPDEAAAAFYVKNHGGFAEPQRMAKPIGDPLGTVTTSLRHGLVVPYHRTGRTKSAAGPLDTVTTHDRFALLTEQPAAAELRSGHGTGAQVSAQDCRYRMIQPRESLAAQRFPDGYVVHGNQGEQTMQAGNAVSANVAQWLGERVAAALDGSGHGDAAT
jgi:DNA (cytosine-5)-methyltransferase 1